MVEDVNKQIEEELLSYYKEGLNSFFEKINDKLGEFLKSTKMEGQKELFEKLVKIRTYPPLLTLLLSNNPENGDWEKARLSSLKAVAEVEGFNKLAEQIEADLAYYEKAKNGLSSLNKGEWDITIQVFEVGSIQEIIRRNGAFREMRGASLLADIIPRYASIYVAEKLGEEFVLTREAGELVFISSPEFSSKLEEGIIGHLRNIPIADAITLKGNGKSPPRLKASDLVNNFGSSYVLALASARAIGQGEDNPVELDPSNICRSCRAAPCLDEPSIDRLLRSFATDEEKVEKLRKNIVERQERGKICQSCLVLASYGLILVDALSGDEKGWNKDVLNAVKSASSFRIFESVKDYYSRKYPSGLGIRFITGLENYDYSESSNALIAMISADGDGFGKLKSESKDIKDFISLSILFSTLMREGFISGAINSLKIEEKLMKMRKATELRQYDFFLPITPFYVAGDDMVFISRAEHIVGFIEGLAQKAEKIASTATMLRILPEDRKVGISMGISVGRTKVPGAYLYDTSHRMLNYTKDITKSIQEKGFTVQASLLYAKSSASWGSIERFDVEKARSDTAYLWRTLIWKGAKGDSPVLKAFKIAVTGSLAVRSADFKDVLEDLLSSGRHKLYHEMALLRWLSDIARGLREEKELYESLREIFRELTEGKSAEVWRSVYTLASLLDIMEDRVRNELGGEDIREKLCEVGRSIWGE